MKRRDEVYLQHILDAIAKVDRYIAGIDEAAFTSETLNFSVDIPAVWLTAKNDLPALKVDVEAILDNLAKNPP